VVPEIGITNVLFISSINSNLRQKLIGLLNFHDRSIFNFCLVIPILFPYGKDNLTLIPATSSTN
jgi:hypothetical protein